jgi:dihydroneopterin aldolase
VAAPDRGRAATDALRIEVRGLRLLGRHGVSEEERSSAQPIEVDLEVEADVARAAATDELSDTVDYAALAEAAAAVVTASSFRLLEALAGAVADAVGRDPRVASVRVTVRKLRPPIALPLDSTAVTLTRKRRGRTS